MFLCFSYLEPVRLFCVFGIFSRVCFELSVPVQVIAWKKRIRNDLLFAECGVRLFSVILLEGLLHLVQQRETVLYAHPSWH